MTTLTEDTAEVLRRRLRGALPFPTTQASRGRRGSGTP
jgi:hypothetical protein